MAKSNSQRRDSRARFEQWVKNAGCEANVISAVHGISMADIAKKEIGKTSMGQSPFAIARGVQFEKSLFYEDAKELKAALLDSNVLFKGVAVEFQDLRINNAAGQPKNQDEAIARTHLLLSSVASTKESKVVIVAAPTLEIPGQKVVLPEARIVFDILILFVNTRPGTVLAPLELGAGKNSNSSVYAAIGEVKTYPDRGGYSDSRELSTARAQAGVYVHGLKLAIENLKLTSKVTVLDRGFLLFTRPGSNRPSLRAGEEFKFQAARAERGFAHLRAVAKQLDPLPEDKHYSTIVSAPTDYSESCIGFCDRAPKCFELSLQSGNPAVLGDDMVRFLAGVSDLSRALDLVSGRQKPNTVAERDFLERVNAADVRRWIS